MFRRRTLTANGKLTSSLHNLSQALMSNVPDDGFPSCALTQSGSGGGGSSLRKELEQDVAELQERLQQELELHGALENAVARQASGGLPEVPRHLPVEAQELLVDVAVLEVAVANLEEQVVALKVQARYERDNKEELACILRHNANNITPCTFMKTTPSSLVLHPPSPAAPVVADAAAAPCDQNDDRLTRIRSPSEIHHSPAVIFSSTSAIEHSTAEEVGERGASNYNSSTTTGHVQLPAFNTAPTSPGSPSAGRIVSSRNYDYAAISERLQPTPQYCCDRNSNTCSLSGPNSTLSSSRFDSSASSSNSSVECDACSSSTPFTTIPGSPLRDRSSCRENNNGTELAAEKLTDATQAQQKGSHLAAAAALTQCSKVGTDQLIRIMKPAAHRRASSMPNELIHTNLPAHTSRYFGSIFKPPYSKRFSIETKSLWKQPNKLSEEMVACMTGIYCHLADSDSSTKDVGSNASQRSSAGSYENTLSAATSNVSSPSPSNCYVTRQHNSMPSPLSLSEADLSSPKLAGRSPSLDLRTKDALPVREKICSPAHGRPGNSARLYGSSVAIEVSWMSVSKQQLEYAADALRTFRSLVEQLSKVDVASMNHEEKLAFWMNVYNALIMHAYLAYGVPRNDLKFFALMQKAAYTVGGHSLNALTIEHVLLKCKAPAYRPQMALLLALHKLKIPAGAHKFAISRPEPLITFGLSCGAASSPPVRIYRAESVHTQLRRALQEYAREAGGEGRVPKLLHSFVRDYVVVEQADVDTEEHAAVTHWLSRAFPHLFMQHSAPRRSSSSSSIAPFDFRLRYLFLLEDHDQQLPFLP